MIEKIYYSLLHRVHIRHHFLLSEISELYISMMIRSIAFGIIGVFVPFYLYDIGFGFDGVALFYGLFFATRVVMDFLSAFIVARFGPKHTIIFSYVMQIFAAYALFALEGQGWHIAVPAATWGIGNSLFYIALHVDFSKVKHSKKSGKEYSLLEVMQRVGMALGPFAGGLIAAVFGPEKIFLITSFLLVLGVIPLLMTPEPVKTKQKISFNSLPVAKMKWAIISNTCAAAENNLRVVMWPLFISLFALGSGVYVKLGAISTVGLVVSVVAAYLVGRLVDGSKGKLLLNAAALSSAGLHLIRPFINTVTGSLLMFIGGDIATTAHHIPYHKGLYDKVEEFPGNRITFMAFLEVISSTVKLALWVAIALSSAFLSVKTIIIASFMACAILSVGITTQKFKL